MAIIQCNLRHRQIIPNVPQMWRRILMVTANWVGTIQTSPAKLQKWRQYPNVICGIGNYSTVPQCGEGSNVTGNWVGTIQQPQITKMEGKLSQKCNLRHGQIFYFPQIVEKVLMSRANWVGTIQLAANYKMDGKLNPTVPQIVVKDYNVTANWVGTIQTTRKS